jgi:hypothetical protein
MNRQLLKNHVINKKQTDKTTHTGLGLRYIDIDYQYSHVLNGQRTGFMLKQMIGIINSSVMKTDKQLVSVKDIANGKESYFFDYRDVIFEMIPCLPGSAEIEGVVRETKTPFLLGTTEVTQELFSKVMGFNYSHDKDPKKPIVAISWFDCLSFCNKLSEYFWLTPYYRINSIEYGGRLYENYRNDEYSTPLSIKYAEIGLNKKNNGFRLPSSTEWFLAYIANNGDSITGDIHVLDSWSDKRKREVLSENGWVNLGSDTQLNQVAQKKPNGWGFYDMLGNVSEWCGDYSGYETPEAFHCGFDSKSDIEDIMSTEPVYKKKLNNSEIKGDNIGMRIAMNQF